MTGNPEYPLMLTSPGDGAKTYRLKQDVALEFTSCYQRREVITLTDAELLQAYKDTGLEPEDIKAMYETVSSVGAPLWRIKELSDADKNERLIVLPCKVGDTVWEFKYGCTIGPDDLCYIPSKACGNCKSLTCSIVPRKVIDIADAALLTRRWGKTIFRTCEEAEATLGGDTE